MCPVYVYSDPESGRTTEITYKMGEAPKSVTVDGVEYERDLAAEHAGSRRGCDAWPMRSEAAAVHPDQVREYTEDSVKRGVPTYFTPDGRPEFRSRGHRARYLKAYRLHDRDAGYSD